MQSGLSDCHVRRCWLSAPAAHAGCIEGAPSSLSSSARSEIVHDRSISSIAFLDRLPPARHCSRKNRRIACATASGACTAMMWPLSMIASSERRNSAA
jgi:hypothetical protein